MLLAGSPPAAWRVALPKDDAARHRAASRWDSPSGDPSTAHSTPPLPPLLPPPPPAAGGGGAVAVDAAAKPEADEAAGGAGVGGLPRAPPRSCAAAAMCACSISATSGTTDVARSTKEGTASSSDGCDAAAALTAAAPTSHAPPPAPPASSMPSASARNQRAFESATRPTAKLAGLVSGRNVRGAGCALNADTARPTSAPTTSSGYTGDRLKAPPRPRVARPPRPLPWPLASSTSPALKTSLARASSPISVKNGGQLCARNAAVVAASYGQPATSASGSFSSPPPPASRLAYSSLPSTCSES